MFPGFGSSYEECRAECVGIYLCVQAEVHTIFGFEGERAQEVCAELPSSRGLAPELYHADVRSAAGGLHQLAAHGPGWLAGAAVLHPWQGGHDRVGAGPHDGSLCYPSGNKLLELQGVYPADVLWRR